LAAFQKLAGAYYTPDSVVASLLSWAIRDPRDRMLDPACGDGRFIRGHSNSVGIEQDPRTAAAATARAPRALVHEGDFFTWAGDTRECFDCAAGNPPFIRYQTFKGDMRERALTLCSKVGVRFSGLASSWAPFLTATASLLKQGGRMAFVVPAEIGHAPYAAPLLEYLVANFSIVHIVAVREKLFPELSEDCWLLYAEGYGGCTPTIRFSPLDRFRPLARPPRNFLRVPVDEWRCVWKKRLRSYLLPHETRHIYREVAADHSTNRLGELANIGIGYVSGANDFFHLRPSSALRLGIGKPFLHASVRNARALPSTRLTQEVVDGWYRNDEPILLLRLPKSPDIPAPVRKYLDTQEGRDARTAYKCRSRTPWYSVPDVQVPNFFLSYMSGLTPSLVLNVARCTCTNSVHSVRLKDRRMTPTLRALWSTSFVQLSCEIEGHPLGGGMLKLEPREAQEILLPPPELTASLHAPAIEEGLETLRGWRHYGPSKRGAPVPVVQSDDSTSALCYI
jgi:adenine-specific DNA-methyltransferase